MILNFTFNFIFIHVPKSAGTSITKFLSQLTTYRDLEIGGTSFGEAIQPYYRKRFNLSKHSTAFEIKCIIGEDTWKKMFTFGFVRNPFTRIYSIYNFLKKWENLPQKYKNLINQFETFEDFILSDVLEKDPGIDNIFKPQTFWLCKPDSSDIMVDFVGRVEKIHDDLFYILKVLGLRKLLNKIDKIPHLNKSEDFDIGVYSNPKVVERVIKIYKVDFEIFGYQTDIESLITQEISKKDERI